MKRNSLLAKTLAVCALTTCIVAAIGSLAQEAVPPPAPEGQPLSGPDLDQLLGPIALYPDPLLSELLPSATFPSQIVMADRYIQGGGDPNLVDEQPWDDSVKAMARYPSVLKWMDDNLNWTTAVGQAFQNQQPDVMASIQRLRGQATSLGNLQSTPQQNVVTDDDGSIEILPADPQEVYVPVYQPSVVFYQAPYGAPYITFGLGLPIGLWLNHDFDWHNHHVYVWGHDHPRPPDWWSRRPGGRPRVPPTTVGGWQARGRPNVYVQGQDRGYEPRPGRSTVSVIHAAPSRPAPSRPAPVINERPVEAPRSRANGALIGSESSQQARQFSSRGQESRGAISAPSHGGGGRR